MSIKTPTVSDIRRMFATIDDHKAVEIMQLEPSLEELEVSLAYLADVTDVMGKERRPLAGKSAMIYEIVIRDEFSEEEEARRS